MKKLLLVAIVLLVAVAAWQLLRADPYSDDLTFSNTMEWDTRLLLRASIPTQYRLPWDTLISLPVPPKNSSPETAQEIELLRSYKALRTPETLQAINNELEFETADFGGLPISEYRDEKKMPATAALLKYSLLDVFTLTMKYKEDFNRVRPHILAPDIAPVIEVPQHPAYPSGHSTEAHFIAAVLSELAPQRRAEFFARAAEIAKHREIAGVHYPSDSAAGALLAQQIITALKSNTEFQQLLTAAQKEFTDRGLTSR